MCYACFLIYLYSYLLVTWEGMRRGQPFVTYWHYLLYGAGAIGGRCVVSATRELRVARTRRTRSSRSLHNESAAEATPHTPHPRYRPPRSERGPCVQAC